MAMIKIDEFSPPEIVAELDKYIIGQNAAKRAVAVALRNRWRRMSVEGLLRDEIMPKNILMMGATGVGKTEIARRLAKMLGAPFIKVEATKFTEVGYVGRDVESIIRDLLDNAINLHRSAAGKQVQKAARDIAIKRIVATLISGGECSESEELLRERVISGDMNHKEVSIEVSAQPSGNNHSFDIPGSGGIQMGVMSISDIIGKTLGSGAKKVKKMTVKEALAVIENEESDKLIDEDKIIRDAIEGTENSGIVFLDEIDKIISRADVKGEVNREGVQRDLLPLLEGAVVNTKHGHIKTDYILFIAAGAFHMARPSELLPELQGRLPVRVELAPLSKDDLVKILKETRFNLPTQHQALLATEKVELIFTDDGIDLLAETAVKINAEIDDIGARRLHALMERLLEDINYRAQDFVNQKIVIDKAYVEERFNGILTKLDLSKFIL